MKRTRKPFSRILLELQVDSIRFDRDPQNRRVVISVRKGPKEYAYSFAEIAIRSTTNLDEYLMHALLKCGWEVTGDEDFGYDVERPSLQEMEAEVDRLISTRRLDAIVRDCSDLGHAIDPIKRICIRCGKPEREIGEVHNEA
jgi:hypothetical protein